MSTAASYPFSRFNRLIHSIGSSPLGARLFARLQHHFDAAIFRLSGGRTTLTTILSGLPIIVITTTGARTGRQRQTTLVALRDPSAPEHLGLVASNWGSQRNPGWYYNLKSQPELTGVIQGVERRYRAHEATTAEYERFWAEATALYPGFARYKVRASHRHIPIMVLTPLA